MSDDDILNNAPTDDKPDESDEGQEYAPLSGEAFDDALEALEQFDSDPASEELDERTDDDDFAEEVALTGEIDSEPGTEVSEAMDSPGEADDDLLGGFLIARERAVEDLPDLSTLAIGGLSVLAVAFTLVFHALLSGRRERGLLFTGLWIAVTVGLIAALVYGIDDQPDAVEWWPLLLVSLGVTLYVNYVIERTHDARLLWLGIICFVAAVVAYGFTSEIIDETAFTDIVDYWPLLLSLVAIGIVPLVFRRHPG
jgi:hypothetical protein